MEEVMNAWNPSWSQMPWKFFTCPAERFQVKLNKKTFSIDK